MSGEMYRDKSKRPSDEGASADLSTYDIIEQTDTNQLRDINQKLFSRLSDIRARNLELRKFEELSWEKDLEIVKLRSIETDLRKQLSGIRNDAEYSQQKREEHIQELTRLRLTIERHDHDLKNERDDYNRKLARIADESWEKDFEIKRLTEQSDSLTSSLKTLNEQRRERETQLAASQERIVKLSQALAEAHAEIDRLEERAESQSAQFADRFAEATGRREDEIARLHAVAVELKSTIAKFEAERAQLQDEIKLQTRSAWELQSRVDESHAVITEMQAAQALEMKRAGEEYSLAIKKANEEHANLLARAKDERSQELASLIRRHEAKLQQNQIEFDQKLAAASEKHASDTKLLREVERELTEQTVRLRIEVSGQAKQIETLNQSIQDLRLALVNEQKQYFALKEELNSRVAELQEREIEIKDLRTAEVAIAAELVTEKEKCRRSEGRIGEMHVRTVDLERQVIDLRDRLTVREESHRNALRTIDELQRKVDLFEANAENLKKAEATLRFELDQERLKRQEDSIANQRAEHESTRRISSLESHIVIQKNEAEALISKQRAEFEAAKEKHTADFEAAREKFQKEIETTREKAKLEVESIRERSRVELENTRERARMEFDAAREKHDARVAELSEMAHDLGTQLHQQRENDAELLAEVGDCRYEIKKLRDEMPLREAAWVAEFAKLKSIAQDELAQARAAASAELAEVKASSAAELEQVRVEAKLALERLIQESDAKLDASEMEKASLRRSLSTKNSNLDVENKESEAKARALAVREQQIAAREHQLRHYATAVTEQKAELIRQTKLLAEEIQMAGKMHPLKDYLQLTEFELSKVDVQLRMTPTLSMDRPRLEACVKQMAEQRDFLRNVVQASTKRLDEQAASILALVKSPKLAATPPLPPKIVIKDKEPVLKVVSGMAAGAPSVASAAVTLVPTKPAQDLSPN
jgi:hypothetical protein